MPCRYRDFAPALLEQGYAATVKLEQIKQLVTYGAIGAASNGIGYSIYLLLTFFGLDPKLAMTLLYATIACVSFFGNKKVTFMYDGHLLGAGVRYLIAHIFGYSINLVILMVFSDFLGYTHAIVQAFAIATVSVYLFITMKFFVFRRVL